MSIREEIAADLRHHRGWVRGAVLAVVCGLAAAHGDILAIFAWWLS